MKSVQTTDQYLCFLQLIKCLKNFFRIDYTKGVRKEGGLGLKTPLELDILQKFYYLRNEVTCFCILFAC